MPLATGSRQFTLRSGRSVGPGFEAAGAHLERADIAGADPDRPVARFGERDRERVGELRRRQNGCDPFAVGAHESAAKAGQDRAAHLIAAHRREPRFVLNDRRNHVLEAAVAIPRQPRTLQANPQRAVGVGRETEHAGDRQRRSRRARLGTELQTVEANQSLLRADPEIAIRRLRDRRHGAAGKSLRGAPAVADVLGVGRAAVARLGAGLRRADDQRDDRQRPPHATGGTGTSQR